MTNADYDAIYRLMERGNVTRKDIVQSYGLNAHTFWLRLTRDRPDLAARYKETPNAARITVSPEHPLEKVMEIRGAAIRDLTTKIGVHDLSVLGKQIDDQNAKRDADPNAELTVVGLPFAKELKAMVQTMGLVRAGGIDSGPKGAGTVVNVNQQTTHQHAHIMRADGKGVLDDIPAEAFVELPGPTQEVPL